MPTDHQRILELAMESLELKKKQIEEEIASINSELQGKSVSRKPVLKAKKKATTVKTTAKRSSRFTKEERLRRSQRMKEYWKNWRKKNAKSK